MLLEIVSSVTTSVACNRPSCRAAGPWCALPRLTLHIFQQQKTRALKNTVVLNPYSSPPVGADAPVSPLQLVSLCPLRMAGLHVKSWQKHAANLTRWLAARLLLIGSVLELYAGSVLVQLSDMIGALCHEQLPPSTVSHVERLALICRVLLHDHVQMLAAAASRAEDVLASSHRWCRPRLAADG